MPKGNMWVVWQRQAQGGAAAGGEGQVKSEPDVEVKSEAKPGETEVKTEAKPDETEVKEETRPDGTEVKAEAKPDETEVKAEADGEGEGEKKRKKATPAQAPKRSLRQKK